MSKYDFLTKYADCEDDNICKMDVSDYDYNKPTMLFVDDSPSTVTLFKRLVKRIQLENNFNVLYSTGNDAGLRVIKTIYCEQYTNFKIDIILTDITFGGSIKIRDVLTSMDGVDLVGILKKLYPNLIYKFITGHVVTGDIRSEIYKKFSEYNNDDDLSKYVTYKDRAISTDMDLVYDIFKGTEYEKYIK